MPANSGTSTSEFYCMYRCSNSHRIFIEGVGYVMVCRTDRKSETVQASSESRWLFYGGVS